MHCSIREDGVMTDTSYFTLTHLDDALMTDQEIRELPQSLGHWW